MAQTISPETLREQLVGSQMDDIAKALDLMLHMIKVLAEEDRPSFEDVGEVQELIERIKHPRTS